VLVSAFLLAEDPAEKLLRLGIGRKARLVVNEYVLKETRAVLVGKLGVPGEKAEKYMLDVIVPNVLILKGPSKVEARRSKLRLRDRSDLPIIIPCVKHDLNLVSLDARLRRDAGRYVRVLSPEEALREIKHTPTE